MNQQNTKTVDSSLKFFAIFKLVMSILYFFMYSLVIGFLFVLDIFGFAIAGLFGGSLEFSKISSLLIILFSIALIIIVAIFTLSIILVRKYNKTMDLILCSLFLVCNIYIMFIDILYIESFIYSFYIPSLTSIVSSVVLIVNIFISATKNKRGKLNESK